MTRVTPPSRSLSFIHSKSRDTERLYAKHLSDNFLKRAAQLAATTSFTHATHIPPDTIQASGKLAPGIGCLGRAVYCVPSPKELDNTYHLHNFGRHVLRHRKEEVIYPLILETAPTKRGGVSYLRFGELFSLSSQHEIVEEKRELLASYLEQNLPSATEMLGIFSNLPAGPEPCQTIDDATNALTTLYHFLTSCKFLSYFYFEAVSISLMILAQDTQSEQLRDIGELNTQLYIDIIHELSAAQQNERFEVKNFAFPLPIIFSSIESLPSGGEIIPDKSSFTIFLANLLTHLIRENIPDEEHLRGWLAYDLFNHSGSYAEVSALERSVSDYLAEYWHDNGIHILYNSIIDKGEFGIYAPEGARDYQVFTAEYLKDSRVERRKLLNVTL